MQAIRCVVVQPPEFCKKRDCANNAIKSFIACEKDNFKAPHYKKFGLFLEQ
jgi:hypothetical protein